MTLAASGAISLADIRTEYVGGSGSISLGDLYRGGSNIKAKAGDNQGTNLAASVPASGTINLANFHGTAKGFKFTYSSTHGNQNFSSLFGDDWDLDYPKVVDINSGVSIYGSGTDAITIPSGLAGGLTLNNAGTIYGFGGAAGGGAGGHCINNAASGVVINNTANIFAGGGGGANGAAGGNGSYTSSTTTTLGPYGQFNPNYLWAAYGSSDSIVWAGSYVGTNSGYSYTTGGYTYSKGSVWYYGETAWYYRVSRTGTTTTTTNTTGGAGGAGGVGQGYNQSAGTGQQGASGGTNAGTGSAGTDGASYGQAATNSANGGNGNVTNGATGNTGGAAGAAVTGTSVTMNNTGTIHGAVA